MIIARSVVTLGGRTVSRARERMWWRLQRTRWRYLKAGTGIRAGGDRSASGRVQGGATFPAWRVDRAGRCAGMRRVLFERHGELGVPVVGTPVAPNKDALDPHLAIRSTRSDQTACSPCAASCVVVRSRGWSFLRRTPRPQAPRLAPSACPSPFRLAIHLPGSLVARCPRNQAAACAALPRRYSSHRLVRQPCPAERERKPGGSQMRLVLEPLAFLPLMLSLEAARSSARPSGG
jgi:hypothetical protein